MNTGQKFTLFGPGLMAMVLTASPALAQVPVDDGGNVIGTYQDPTSAAGTGNEGIPLLTRQELQDLVGPVALYPDDLLAIVLPAATYPLQVVQASRFLEELESNPGLEPDADWDDAIVALLNYPEIVELLNEDLDWTWRLGEAVVAQQADVVNAVEAFRNTAYAAGNLRSDDYQQVSRDEGVIEITPLNDDIIYVPYYEPESVVVYQPRPVYFYYERPRPVYYYPYADTYAFHSGFFWGVTTAFTIAWASDSLHVYHHSYYGHPYYGHHYRTRWWYRQPSIYTHNTIYRGGNHYRASNWYSHGDYWRSSRNRHLRHSDQRVTRNRQYTNRNVQHAVTTTRSHTSTFRAVATANQHTARRQTQSRSVPRHETRYVARNEPRHQTRHSTRSEPRPQTRQATRSEPRNEARHVARNEPRRESHSEARREPRSEPRSEPRREPQRASQNHERREQRSANQQSRGREQPRRRKN